MTICIGILDFVTPNRLPIRSSLLASAASLIGFNRLSFILNLVPEKATYSHRKSASCKFPFAPDTSGQ